MVLYGFETLLFMLASDWLGLAFHVWVLLGLWGGLQACRQLRETEAPSA